MNRAPLSTELAAFNTPTPNLRSGPQYPAAGPEIRTLDEPLTEEVGGELLIGENGWIQARGNDPVYRTTIRDDSESIQLREPNISAISFLVKKKQKYQVRLA
ncbi:MAG: hypothetical protein Q9180_005409 [Flavoplaca navasiana]